MKKISFASIAILLSTVSFCYAQTDQVPPSSGNIQAPSQPATISSPVNCFDYYKFQSVQVSIGTDKDSYKPGETARFKGEVINENNYPVVDGYVFARIGRKNLNYVNEGNYTVDEFIPLDEINLNAGEKKSIAFNRIVPVGTTDGDYRVDFFFSVGKKFNLGGLPFTNEVVIGATEFNVQSSNNSSIFFDKSGTEVNGEKYNHIGNWPVINPNAKVDIVQPLKNTFKTEESVNIQYDLYFWDSLNEKDKIESKSEKIVLPANGSTNLAYTIPEMKDSVYLLKITAATSKQKSIVNIRVVSDQAHPRLNYPAITKFPLQKGDSDTVFSCFYNSAPSNTSGQLSVVLQDNKGNQIVSLDYKGGISGAMMADKKDFTAQNNYNWIKLIATLKDANGKITDQYETIYDCQEINSSDCTAVSAKIVQASIISGNQETASNSKGNIFYAVIILLLIIVAIVFFVRRKKAGNYFKLLIFLVAGGSFILLTPSAYGYNDKTVTVNTNYSKNWQNDPYFYTINGTASILHRVSMANGNYTVSVGDPVRFAYNPDTPFFNSTGSWIDTPYGAWCPDLSKACGGTWEDFASYYMTFLGEVPISNDVTAVKPNVSMTSSDISIVSCNGMNCVANKAGTATLTANIGAVSGMSWVAVNETTYRNDKTTMPLTFPAASLSWDITVTQSTQSCSRCSLLKKYDNVTFQSTDATCQNVVPSTNPVTDNCNCSCTSGTDTTWPGYASCAGTCPPSPTCTGNTPDPNCAACSNQNPAVNTPKVLVPEFCSGNPCEYYCSPPLKYENGKCINDDNPPASRYSCDPSGKCVEDPAGSFVDSSCNNTCDPGGWREVAP